MGFKRNSYRAACSLGKECAAGVQKMLWCGAHRHNALRKATQKSKVVRVLHGAQVIIRRAGVAAENIVVDFIVIQLISTVVLFLGKMPLRLVFLFITRKFKGHSKAPFKYI